MTVQELITKLQNIEDKSLRVFVNNHQGTLGDVKLSDETKVALNIDRKEGYGNHDKDLRKYRGHDVEIVRGIILKPIKGYEKSIS